MRAYVRVCMYACVCVYVCMYMDVSVCVSASIDLTSRNETDGASDEEEDTVH